MILQVQIFLQIDPSFLIDNYIVHNINDDVKGIALIERTKTSARQFSEHPFHEK
jgi:hypothetical protein